MFRFRQFLQPFYEADGVPGGSTNADIVAILKEAATTLSQQRGGTEPALLSALQTIGARDNEIAQLKAKLPAEGTTPFSAGDKTLFDSYRALGTPEELTAALADLKETKKETGRVTGELTTAQKELADQKRERTIAKAAKLVNYNEDVSRDLPGLPTVEIVKQGDKDVAEVVEESGTRTELTAYIAANKAAFLPALKPVVEQQSTGTRYPPQTTGEPPKPQNAAQSYIDATYKKSLKRQEAA